MIGKCNDKTKPEYDSGKCISVNELSFVVMNLLDFYLEFLRRGKYETH